MKIISTNLKFNNFKTVKEIAEIYGVTDMAVRLWIKKGLQYKTEKVLRLRPRKIIDIKDVDNFLKIGVKK